MFLYYWYLRLLYGDEAVKKAEKSIARRRGRK